MIRIGKDTKDIKFGDKQLVKVCKGSDIIWENAEEVLLEIHDSWAHYINVTSSDILTPHTPYRFKTSLEYENYTISVNGKNYNVKNKDVFIVSGDCLLLFKNDKLKNFTITITKTNSKPNLTINI